MDEKLLKSLYRILLRLYKETDDYKSIISGNSHITMPYSKYTSLQKTMAFFLGNLYDSYSKRLSQTIILLSIQDIIECAINESTNNSDMLSLFIDEYNKQHQTNYVSPDSLLKIILKISSSRNISLCQIINELFDYGLHWAKTPQGHDYWSEVNYKYIKYLNSRRINDLILKKFQEHIC